MAELMANPDIRKKAQAELDAVVQDRLVQESDIPNLPFLQAIVKENYRMHPSAPLSVRHESHEPCVISGCEFPALTELIMNIFAIHRDPSVYENPDKFDPTRFVRSPEVDPVAGNDFYQLMRFGAGRRMCPGQQLGNTMVTSMLANLLQCFEWETATSERESGGGGGDEVGVDIANHYSFINYRQKPLYLLTKPPRLASLLQPTLAIILFLSTPQQILFSDGFTSSLLSLFLSYLVFGTVHLRHCSGLLRKVVTASTLTTIFNHAELQWGNVTVPRGKNSRFVGVLDILGSGHCSCTWTKIVRHLGSLRGIASCASIKGCGNARDEAVL
ncbi:flavonoid 3'-monooxygenase [Physcomitrium patens]|uniref:flavonoid 3'-monooxygenase n=1 Tax=Physcomitrium patens TaxID=3218 RepID=UPI003CCCA79F